MTRLPRPIVLSLISTGGPFARHFRERRYLRIGMGHRPFHISMQGFTSLPLSRGLTTFLALVALLVLQPALGAQTSPQAIPGDRPIADVIAQLFDPQTDAAQRRAAAQFLAARTEAQALDALSGALVRNEPPGVRIAAATAIAEADRTPPDLVRPLASALARAADSDLETILAALARYRTRAAIRAVLDLFDRAPAAPPASTQRAFGVLRQQTGRFDLADDPQAWRDWWQTVAPMSQEQWLQEVSEAQARRAARAEMRREASDRQLVEIYRRLYTLTPEDRRSDLLAELLSADLHPLNTLGIELARRALLNAKTLGPQVAAATAGLLSNPRAELRAEAASLLSKLDPETYATAIADALNKESDELAATGLLRATARCPLASSTLPVIRWLSASTTTRVAALEAALALRRAGLLDQADQLTAVNNAILSLPAEANTPAIVALMGLVGLQEQAAALLQSPRPEIAIAAAETLAEHPASIEALLAAASNRPDLFPAASRALMLHRPTSDGFAAVASLPAPTPERRTEALVAFARALPPTDLLIVGEAERQPATRNAYLTHIARPDFLTPGPQLAARQDLALMLVRARLDLGDPGAALAAITTFQSPEAPSAAELFDASRVVCLLWLDRIPEAVELTQRATINPVHWLDTLERIIATPHAAAVADAFLKLFDSTLGDADRARFRSLEQQIAAPIVGPPVSLPTDPPAAEPRPPQPGAAAPRTDGRNGADAGRREPPPPSPMLPPL